MLTAKTFFSAGELFSVSLQRTLTVYYNPWQNITSKAFLSIFGCLSSDIQKHFYFEKTKTKQNWAYFTFFLFLYFTEFFKIIPISVQHLHGIPENASQQRNSVHISSRKNPTKQNNLQNLLEYVSFPSYIQWGILKIQYLPLCNDFSTQNSSFMLQQVPLV